MPSTCYFNRRARRASFLFTTRVCKDPPYKVEESGYAGFILPIEVYFRNKEEPRKVRFDYDLFLHLEGHPPVNHLRCEKLTFNNPTEEFRRKLLKAGGQRDPHKTSLENSKVMVLQEESTFGQHLKLSTHPSNSLTVSLSESKKNKSFQQEKDGTKGTNTTLLTTTTTNSNRFSKLHKPSKDHKEKPLKDSKEPKSAFKDCGSEPSSKASKDSRKPKENQPLRDTESNPKMGFKEPKSLSKEHRTKFVLSYGTGPGISKRLLVSNNEDNVTKKRKKGFLELPVKAGTGTGSLPHPHHVEKKLLKDKSQMCMAKQRINTMEMTDITRAPTLPQFQELVDPNDLDMEGNICTKSESKQPSPASSSSSSSSSFIPSHKHQVLGPLQSIMQDLHSDDNVEEPEEEEDNEADSDLEWPMHTHMTHCHRRISLSDGSESENSPAPSPLSHNNPPPLLKTSNNQAYLDELVELHRRLMALRERHILQQIVNLIEETGHFHITNTTFDFDLCSLDKTTVRKLQSYLETSGIL
ncbi:protein AF-9 isoform X2 [Hypomesus transpacificus]|uniref:protein AF-9 isoform X2 n=1 Tax=Hypomesus transpacificus TaxID=137520 RepID=UPI001F087AF1|nr:protein AF-9 isoform X2 [Hypomesus transpacificus]